MNKSFKKGIKVKGTDYYYELSFRKGKVIFCLYDCSYDGESSLLNNINSIFESLQKNIFGLKDAIIITRDRDGCFEQILNGENGLSLVSLNGSLDYEEALCISESKTPFLHM